MSYCFRLHQEMADATYRNCGDCGAHGAHGVLINFCESHNRFRQVHFNSEKYALLIQQDRLTYLTHLRAQKLTRILS